VILGVTGNGLHTNGYSLARKVLLSKYNTDDYIAGLGMTIGESLLQIHPSYLQVIRQLKKNVGIRGFAHITGGGIIGNTGRIVPVGLQPVVDWDSWEWPAIFSLIRKEGDVPVEDMRQAFNLGIGLTVVVSPDTVENFMKTSLPGGFRIHQIGEIRTSR
jgi:phosphoribosylformylglycinamidine cyclo-ligase